MSAIHSQKLHTLISYITHETNTVFWMRTGDYQSLIYISPNYETKWGFNCQQLQTEDLAYWYRSVYAEDLKNPAFINAMKQRKKITTAENCFLVRYEQENNKLLHVLNHSHILYPADAEKPIIAGIGQLLTPHEWQDARNKTPEALSGMVQKEIFEDILSLLPEHLNCQKKPSQSTNILSENLDKKKYYVHTFQGVYILSRREATCLYHLIHGHSAKQIAYALSLSSRTIECYIAHLKIKLKCRKILELIKSIKNVEAILQWTF